MFTVFTCSGVQVFRVDDILEGQKGDHGGGPKMAKILGGVKFQHVGASSSAKKVLLTAEKVGSAKN